MSYNVRTTSCKPQTSALTSNHKFLPVRDLLYLDQYSFMMRYPGNSTVNDINSYSKPEEMKTFQYPQTNSSHSPQNNLNEESCSTCSKS